MLGGLLGLEEPPRDGGFNGRFRHLQSKQAQAFAAPLAMPANVQRAGGATVVRPVLASHRTHLPFTSRVLGGQFGGGGLGLAAGGGGGLGVAAGGGGGGLGLAAGGGGGLDLAAGGGGGDSASPQVAAAASTSPQAAAESVSSPLAVAVAAVADSPLPQAVPVVKLASLPQAVLAAAASVSSLSGDRGDWPGAGGRSCCAGRPCGL